MKQNRSYLLLSGIEGSCLEKSVLTLLPQYSRPGYRLQELIFPGEIHHIDRGYKNIEEKFRKLGVNIERVTI